MDKVRTLEVAPGEEDSRLDRWLKRRWPHLNHVQIHKLTRSGQIRVDGGFYVGQLPFVGEHGHHRELIGAAG